MEAVNKRIRGLEHEATSLEAALRWEADNVDKAKQRFAEAGRKFRENQTKTDEAKRQRSEISTLHAANTPAEQVQALHGNLAAQVQII